MRLSDGQQKRANEVQIFRLFVFIVCFNGGILFVYPIMIIRRPAGISLLSACKTGSVYSGKLLTIPGIKFPAVIQAPRLMNL
jgi:hypothetical protein